MKFYCITNYDPLIFKRIPATTEEEIRKLRLSDKQNGDGSYEFINSDSKETYQYFQDIVYEKDDDFYRVSYLKVVGEIKPIVVKRRTWYQRFGNIFPTYTENEVVINWHTEKIEKVVAQVIIEPIDKPIMKICG